MTGAKVTDKGVCLVTGGAGFIGCALSTELTKRFAKVVVIDNLHPQIHPHNGARPAALDAAAELFRGDVTSPDDWDKLLTTCRPGVVIHLAAETGTAQSLTEASRHAIVNTVGTACMLDSFSRHDHIPGHFILTSSRAIYGEGCWQRSDGTEFYPGQRTHAQLEQGQWDFAGARAIPARADRTQPSPSSVYGATKLAQEHILRAWALALGSSVSILRLQNVYGPGQSLTNPYTGIVPFFFRIAKKGDSIPLYEDGSIVRDFIFIDDVADALLAALSNPPESVRLLDAGSGRASTIRELALSIAQIYGAPEPTVCGKFRDGDVRAASCDIEPIFRELGWRPKFDLSTGLGFLKSWIDDKL